MLHTLLTPLTIFLALVAAVVLANTITFLIYAGGKSSPSVDSATEMYTQEEIAKYEKESAIAECECRCHRETMYPGMRCLDCFGEPCDQGTTEAEES
jgi:hypothetical protein